ncbi:hypothetical protein F383_07310 [Gossypium arboreum]|uniref:Uncharacterized protein n=1 Tax=Gossypium arboreum TaxID=29729 RepID=A0A0B0PAU0_GOSAR|nr:hypothetical protein F383_07310 [Gossypium arboreum]
MIRHSNGLLMHVYIHPR